MIENLLATLEVQEVYSPHFKPRLHKVCVSTPYNKEDKPKEGEIAFFNVYSVTRQYGGHEEGGWWYDHTHLEFTVPFIYNQETALLMIKAHEEKIKDIPRGNIESVLGGVEAFVMIEREAGASASEGRPTYE